MTAEELIARNRQIVAEAERVRRETAKRREEWMAQQREIEAQRSTYFWAHRAKRPDKD
jgi:vacuolar-type H+-ATPase subunit D/Vma8